MMAGRGRLGAAVIRAGVVREIRGNFSTRTKTFFESDVGGTWLRHFGLEHLPIGTAQRPLTVSEQINTVS